LIRELKEQNDRLKKQLQTGHVDIKDLKEMSDSDNVSLEGTCIYCVDFMSYKSGYIISRVDNIFHLLLH